MIDKIGELEIHISGLKGNVTLSPANYDIKEIQLVLSKVDDLLYPLHKKDRPLITYNLQEGSVKNIFKTGIQAIISFNAIMGQIITENSIDFLDIKTAEAIESMQNLSYEKNYTFEITTSVDESEKLLINPSTHYIRSTNLLVDTEMYFYGSITDAGGKKNPNIHLETKDFGMIVIDTPKNFLENKEDNLLYKNFGIRAIGKMNVNTGEIDKHSFKFIELIDYESGYDESYLSKLILKAKNNWLGVDPDKWLQELRGNYGF